MALFLKEMSSYAVLKPEDLFISVISFKTNYVVQICLLMS